MCGRRLETSASASSLSRAVRVCETLVFEDACNEVANIRLVVDDENVMCHGLNPSRQSPVATSVFVSLLVSIVISRDITAIGFSIRRTTGHGKPQPHPGSPRARSYGGSVVEFELSTMVFQHTPHNRQTKAGAFLAGRHVGLKQPRS